MRINQIENLHIQAESNDSRLISHPLVVNLLTLKLRKYASACYLLQLLLHLILLLCLTVFALTIINPKDLICKLHVPKNFVFQLHDCKAMQ